MPVTDAAGLKNQKFYTGPDGNLSIHEATLTFGGEDFEGNDNQAANRQGWFIAGIAQGARIHEVTAVVLDAGPGSPLLDVGLVQKGDGSWADDEDSLIQGLPLNANSYLSSVADRKHGAITVDQPAVFLFGRLRGADIPASEPNVAVEFKVYYEFIGNL